MRCGVVGCSVECSAIMENAFPLGAVWWRVKCSKMKCGGVMSAVWCSKVQCGVDWPAPSQLVLSLASSTNNWPPFIMAGNIFQSLTLQYNAVKCSDVQCSAVNCSVVQ